MAGMVLAVSSRALLDSCSRLGIDRQVSVAEAAYLPGSAEHSAFNRWTGTAPTELRKRA